MYIFYTASTKKTKIKKGWHILKIEQYKNANKLQKFLLLFKKENVEFRAGVTTKATHYRVLFGVKYITRQYRIH